MSNRKRSYPFAGMGGATGASKQRSVGGRTLTYRPSAPVAYSSRWYNTTAVKAAVRGASPLKGVDTDVDISPVLATTNTNAGIFQCNLVQQGSGSWNRVGRKIAMKSLRLKLQIRFSAAAPTTTYAGNQIRYIVVYDKQPSGVLPTFNTIFGRTIQDGTESCEFMDPARFDNMDRFTVLLDRTVCMQPPASATTGGTYAWAVDEYLKLGNRETVFSGQSAPMTIADTSSGALYFIMRADSANVAGQAFLEASMARLRYTDA